MFLQNILIKENNNYTKRILHSHTDHYRNITAMNWKNLTTEQLNRPIACHRSKQTKNKSPVLAHKTHHSIVLGSITFPTDNFQLKPEMFSQGRQERFCYCFHHTSTNLAPEKNTCICWIGGTVGQTTSLDIVEKIKIPCPYQHSKLWNTNQGLSLIGWPIPGPTAISKYLNISCMNCQSHCIMAVTKSHWKWTWTTISPETVDQNQVIL